MNVYRCTCIVFCILGMVRAPVTAQVTLLGVQYRPDQAFPEHECFWHPDEFPGPCGPSLPLGASLHVFLHNIGSSSVTVQDVFLNGISLKSSIVQSPTDGRHPASIWFANLSSEELETLLNAGEPVWYKSDPTTIAPGSVGQVVIRLRETPMPDINIDVVHSEGTTSTTIPINPNQPRVAGVGFSADLATAYLYWRRSDGTAPTTVLLDGDDVTANVTTVNDPNLEIAVSVLQLNQPLTAGSFHVFQGSYADGQTASAGLRAWANKFIYGTWGARPGPDGDANAGRAWIDEATNHCVNALVVTGGSGALYTLLDTPSGRQYAEDHDYGFVITYDGQFACHTPLMWFIKDEPDAADYSVAGLPSGSKVGSMAMTCIEHGETDLRPEYPAAPTTLNIDATYRPFNWYNYGQVPDVLMTDPYYQVQLRLALWHYTERIPLYTKATFIYAATQLAQSSCEPNPLHVVLYSCEWIDNSPGVTFPFPTPESKRIEVYYALAGGAKGLSYWWFLPGGQSNGLGAGGPEAEALWHEIGLLGAEVRTAAPLLVTSTPAPLSIETSPGLWARSLLVGTDTVILLVVNDQYSNDEEGCHYTPVTDANLTVTLPTWLTSPSAFEIAADGIYDVSTQSVGNQLQVDLGVVDLTRMIVVTSDLELRATMQQRYVEEVWPRVCAIEPRYCAPPESPPIIQQQPLPQDVALGGTATFTLFAIGSGTLNYQWQKDGGDLVDDGHYTGTTTDTLTISNVNGDDLGSYQCVVTNAYGTEISNPAALTLVTATFTGIGALPGETASVITGISADGSVVCGTSGSRAIIWSSTEGIKDLGLPTGVTTASAVGVGIYNGNVVVAVNTDAPSFKAKRWDGNTAGVGTYTDLPRIDGALEWNARGLGTDGVSDLWIAGSSFNGGDGDGRQAGLYQQSAGSTTGVELPPNGHDHSDLHAVADNGYAAGQYQYNGTAPSGGARNAMKYEGVSPCTALNTYLLDQPSWLYEAIATAISRDGLVQGGWSSYDYNSTYRKPVIWNNGATPTNVPFIPGDDGDNYGEVRALNGDGTLAGGYSYYEGGTGADGPKEAFLWDAGHGTRQFQNVLATQYGVTLNDWTLQEIRAISADGRVIAGNGMHDGVTEGWVVTLVPYPPPPPPTILEQPQPQHVCQGGIATFSVSATGEGTLTYQWQKDGSDLADGGHYAGVTTSTLTVSDVDINDEGEYQCVVSNIYGSNTSEAATLTVTVSQQPGDYDCDNDVDQSDYGHLQACLTGPEVAVGAGCLNADLNNDGYVDQGDVAIFRSCTSGANIAADPDCAAN